MLKRILQTIEVALPQVEVVEVDEKAEEVQEVEEI